MQWSHGCVEATGKGDELPMMALAVGMQSSELRGVRAPWAGFASGVGAMGSEWTGPSPEAGRIRWKSREWCTLTPAALSRKPRV